MKFTGPLGFNRLSNFGPLVSEFPNSTDLSGTYSNVIVTAAKRQDITLKSLEADENQESGLSDLQTNLMIKEIANIVYSDDDNVTRARRFRFCKCMVNSWAEEWSTSLINKQPDVYKPSNDFDELSLKTGGCIGMTENLTSDKEKLIPQFLKKENLPVPEDAPEPPIAPENTPNLPDTIDDEQQLPNVIRDDIL